MILSHSMTIRTRCPHKSESQRVLCLFGHFLYIQFCFLADAVGIGSQHGANHFVQEFLHHNEEGTANNFPQSRDMTHFHSGNTT